MAHRTTIPRRTAAPTRFGRAPHTRMRPTKARTRKKSPSGVGGVLTSVMNSLPVGRRPMKRKATGGSSKARPALALLAAAGGAVLGRQQMKKRGGGPTQVPVNTNTPPA